jgi:WD40 repeat protein
MKSRFCKAVMGFLLCCLVLPSRATPQAINSKPEKIGALSHYYGLLKFSPDGRYLAICAVLKELKTVIWDVKTRRVVRTFGGERVFWAPDSQHIALIATLDDSRPEYQEGLLDFSTGVRFYDLKTNKFYAKGTDTIPRIQGTGIDEWRDAAFSPDGKQFVVVSSVLCRSFDSANGKLMRRVKYGTAEESLATIPLEESDTIHGALSPDTRSVLQGICEGELFDTQTGARIRSFAPIEGVSGGVGYSPDGTIYWDSNLNQEIYRFWDAKTAKLIRTWHATSEASIRFTPDSKALVVPKPHGIELREVRSGQVVKILPSPEHRFDAFAFSPDGTTAISCDGKGTLWQWRLR